MYKNHKDMRGAWVGWSVKPLALDFSLGHDLKVVRSSPTLGSVLSTESAEVLSLPLPLLVLPLKK